MFCDFVTMVQIMSECAIKIENLSKVYKLYDRPIDRLKESLSPFRKKYHRDFYALKDVSLEVRRGETIGIIGKNGAGKSTLLKVLTGVLTPSGGSVQVNGKVSSLLELGVGFNPELSGLENVYFNGTVLGYTKAEIDVKLDDILAFADIGEFVKQPVKTYSSGMMVRLAFAVATSIDPDILIVDEALSVGDMFFQAKCMARMKKMIEDNGTTLVFVSHDVGSIKSLCEKTMLLDRGGVVDYGRSDRVVAQYLSMKIKSSQKVLKKTDTHSNSRHRKEGLNDVFINNAKFNKLSSFERIQNGKASFINVQLLDENEKDVVAVEYGRNLILRMAIEIREDMDVLAFGYHVREKNGNSIVYTDSVIEGEDLRDVKKGEEYIIDWRFKGCFMQGDYTVTAVLSVPIDLSISQVDFCDFVPIASQFKVLPRDGSFLYGYVYLNNEVEIIKND